MEECLKKDLLYNNVTNRCYKSCEKKNKVTHPITKKCRQPCSNKNIRRPEDFRCVKNPLNRKTRKLYKLKPNEAVETNNKKRNVQASVNEELEELELVQPPLKKELKKNFEFLADLIQKGKGKTVSYDGNSVVSDFISVYFHEKYKQHCPMYPIKTYSSFEEEEYKKVYELSQKMSETQFKEYMLKNNRRAVLDWNKDKFLKNLKLCLETGEQLIMVPLILPRHLNMLIIKVPTREIIRFEPHGKCFKKEVIEKKTNIFLENLTTDINTSLNLTSNRKFMYVEPYKICPLIKGINIVIGFQSMETRQIVRGKDEGYGFCQLWSWFFAECVIQNPEMDIKEVYKEAFDALRADKDNFATIIRGYFYSINDELKKFNKDYSIEKNTKFEEFDDVLITYLNQNQVKLKNKERKTFQGGVVNKKSKFILPKANPKATPMKL